MLTKADRCYARLPALPGENTRFSRKNWLALDEKGLMERRDWCHCVSWRFDDLTHKQPWIVR